MADETPVDTLDADLAALMAPATPAAAVTPETPTLGDPAAVAPIVDGGVTPPADDPLAALETIEEPKVVEEPKSTLTPEQEQILKIVPSAQVAEQVAQTAANYNNFTATFERGDYQAVEAMFEAWNPAAFEGFLEHVYNRKVASGEWVDRWIADKEGNPTTNKAVTRLEQQIKSLQTQLQGRTNQEQQTQQQQAAQKVFADYNAHVEKLFETIKFAAADRRWVKTDLDARVGNSPQVKAAIMAGNLSAANTLFKQAVREYVERDKATAAVKAGVLAGQEGKKTLLQSAPQAVGALPSNVKEVPRDKLDEWQDQELTNLFATAGRKKG